MTEQRHSRSGLHRIYYDPTGPAELYLNALGDSLANYIGGDNNVSGAGYNPTNHTHAYNAVGTVRYDFGGAQLQSITAYRDIRSDRGVDLDGTPYALFDFYTYDSYAKQFSQELQLSGAGFGNRLKWIVGTYYFNEHGGNVEDIVPFFLAPTPTTPQLSSENEIYGARNKSSSIFAQATFEVMSDVRLTGGVRYVHDSREISYRDTIKVAGGDTVLLCNGPGTATDPTPRCEYSPGKATFNYVPWTVGVDYKPAQSALVYGKISKGFRSGGFPLGGGNDMANYAEFDPENILQYEVGAKLDLFDRKLRLNGAAYYSDYKNIQQQVTRVDPVSGIPLLITQNVGAAHIKGFELEATALLGKLRLNGSLGVIDPNYKRGPLVGTPLINTAKTTWSAAADYPVNVSGGTLTFHVDYSWRSKVYFYSPINHSPAQVDAVSQKGYGLLNAQISFRIDDTPLSFAIFGRNLTDKDYAVRTMDFTQLGGLNTSFAGAPRLYGGRVTYTF